MLLAGWLRGLGGASFATLGVFLCALPLPGLTGLVNSVAGLVFGTLAGSLVFTAVATAGAVATFLVGRSALRERVARATARWRPQIRALDTAVEKDAFRIIVLLRVSPLIPFGLSSLLLSFTPLPLQSFALATAAGVLPGALPFAYAGKLSGNLVDSEDLDRLQMLLSALGLAATVAVSWRLAGVARDALEATSTRNSATSAGLAFAEEGGGNVPRTSSGSALRATGAAGRAAAAAVAPRLITLAPTQARISVTRGPLPTVAAPSRAD